MKIIAVQGKKGIGKTSIFESINKELEKIGNKIFYKKFYEICPKDTAKRDFVAIYKIKEKVIGIISTGDYKDFIDCAYKELKINLKNINLDLLMCAVRTKGGPVQAIENIAKKEKVDHIYYLRIFEYTGKIFSDINTMYNDIAKDILSLILLKRN